MFFRNYIHYPVARKSIKNLKGLSPLIEDPVGDAIAFRANEKVFSCGSQGPGRPANTCEAHRSRQQNCHSRRLILFGTPARGLRMGSSLNVPWLSSFRGENRTGGAGGRCLARLH
jgi:hypothetical protein